MKFGRKLSRNLNQFGKKTNHTLNNLGKKGGTLDLVERKFFNSIDTITPAVALAADLHAPGSGAAINKANDGLQGLHAGIRRGVKQIQTIKKATGQNRKDAIVNFGDNIEDVRREVNKSNTLLRDANKAVKYVPPTPVQGQENIFDVLHKK
jgi:hypothetical protein